MHLLVFMYDFKICLLLGIVGGNANRMPGRITQKGLMQVHPGSPFKVNNFQELQ